MEFHGIDMVGPLNTDNIRAQDGTLAATIDDTTGKVNFQDDVDVAGDLDVLTDARVFQNLEVQGPLASFLQSISVGGFAGIVGSLAVGVDADIGHDLDVQNDVLVGRWLTILDRTSTVNLRMTGHGPGVGKILTAVDGVGNVTWGTGGTAGIASVPTGQSILFYTNATVLGYVIETLIADDDVVYITKGTAAGGQAGGQAKPGSTWSHDHGVVGVNAWHNHKWYDRRSWAADGITRVSFAVVESGPGVVTDADDDKYNPNHMWTQRTNVALTGNVDAQTAWRPKGHNFTLQTRL